MPGKPLEAALAILKEKGIWQINYAPPVYRLAWRLGIEIPPPHFRSFLANFLTTSVLFGVLFGAWIWVVDSAWNVRTSVLVNQVVFAGLIFGICLASYYLYGRRRYDMPAWDALKRQ